MTTRRYYRLARCQINFLKFILEAYDNVAVVSTLDASHAVVQITIAPGCETFVDGILTGLAGDIGLIPLDQTKSGDVVQSEHKIANRQRQMI